MRIDEGVFTVLWVTSGCQLGNIGQDSFIVVFAVDSTFTACTSLFTLRRKKLQNLTLTVPLAESSV